MSIRLLARPDCSKLTSSGAFWLKQATASRGQGGGDRHENCTVARRRDFIKRLDRGELTGNLCVVLSKLSYEQLLCGASNTAERIEKKMDRQHPV
jgi:hypothetical protein